MGNDLLALNDEDWPFPWPSSLSICLVMPSETCLIPNSERSKSRAFHKFLAGSVDLPKCRNFATLQKHVI